MNQGRIEESISETAALLEGAGPECAMVLGSGWGDVVQRFTISKTVDYSDISCMGRTQVQGHSGKLHLAQAHGTQLLVFQGRRHWYEGSGWEPVAFPVCLCLALGVPAILLTNAAGGIRDGLRPGDLMVIDDHINAMGVNPLVGPHNPMFGPRFPDQTTVYDTGLRGALDRAAADMGHPVSHGVYLAASGPTYETPAEIAAYRAMGADAVGMSTVPEAMLANAAGIRVGAISCITNMAAGITGARLSHEEVIAETDRAKPVMCELLDRFARGLQGCGDSRAGSSAVQ